MTAVKRSLQSPAWAGIHVGVIMDGNGRWARARGLPRTSGHRAGVRAAREAVEAATRAGIGTLTIYAFSADNWTRPATEVSALMRLLRRTLMTESRRCVQNGVRLSVIGRRDRLSPALLATIREAERTTAGGRNLHLRVAVDYSGRDAIMRAARMAGGEAITREAFSQLVARADHDPAPGRDVDLLIRTGGERRISDFLVWESAYAELYFTDTMWPDFGESDLLAALDDYASRDRRFGGLATQAAS